MHLIVVAANLRPFGRRPYFARRASHIAVVVDRQFGAERTCKLIADLHNRFRITSMEVVYVDPDPDPLDCEHGDHDYRGVQFEGSIIGVRCERCGDFMSVDPVPAPDRVLVRN